VGGRPLNYALDVMKASSAHLSLLCATLGMLSACTSIPVNPGRVSISLSAPAQRCGASDSQIPVEITLRNDSAGKLKLWIGGGGSGPPYDLNWLAYSVLANGEKDWRLSGGGHGPLTGYTLEIGTGDQARVKTSVWSLEPSDYGKTIRIRIEDTEGNEYVSDPFQPCVMPSRSWHDV
jgi:hypothetical protein